MKKSGARITREISRLLPNIHFLRICLARYIETFDPRDQQREPAVEYAGCNTFTTPLECGILRSSVVAGVAIYLCNATRNCAVAASNKMIYTSISLV